jgi:prepilin-type N-terminal cleavage/methylation domain-containing protein
MSRAGLEGESGFSLTELMIVLTVGVIITASAVPFADFVMTQYSLVLTAEGVANELQYARMKAVSSNEAFRVRFGLDNTYEVLLEDGTRHAGPFWFGRNVGLNTVDGGNAISFPGNEVLFLPNGALPLTGTGSAGRLKLMTGSGLRVDIVVDGGGMIRRTPTYKSPPAPF